MYVISHRSTLTSSLPPSSPFFMCVILQAQDLVLELLATKVDELLDSSLPFVDLQPLTLPRRPHDYAATMVDFLTVTLMWLTHLPLAARYCQSVVTHCPYPNYSSLHHVAHPSTCLCLHAASGCVMHLSVSMCGCVCLPGRPRTSHVVRMSATVCWLISSPPRPP